MSPSSFFFKSKLTRMRSRPDMSLMNLCRVIGCALIRFGPDEGNQGQEENPKIGRSNLDFRKASRSQWSKQFVQVVLHESTKKGLGDGPLHESRRWSQV